ncbi:DJ-1/PfpI family protein [Spirosoma sp.]|uniref:DJ-1/PfpI family protein n=1 Tax=Spirosoma sp. TaxID=1899569 RepID=UPI00262DCFFE|nr:DJ-1/PfpI family protein [Spirosoma sp.]MCX6215612.1 DJ-1/PfpI family protein [Spirosoma sp.]
MKKISQSLCILLLLTIYTSRSTQAQTATARDTIRVAILLFPGVELLDFAGPLEVFNHMEGARVYTVAAQSGPMTIMQKMLTVVPEYTPSTAPQADILVVPGGRMEEVMQDSSVVNWIRRTTAQRKLTMSVCTGAQLLSKAGLLTGKTVTTHWAATHMLQQMTPTAIVMENTRFVDQGSIITTAGVSAGIDGALHVVSRLKGVAAAEQIARIMEYDKWEPQAGLVVGKARTQSKRKANPIATKPTVVKKTVATKQAQLKLTSTIDPVCQMSVDGMVADTARYMGKTYGFCSRLCKDRFKKEPTAFLKR